MSPDLPFDDADRSSRLEPRSRADDEFVALQAWILGLPWVVSGNRGVDVPHHIVIDCAPLHVRHVWAVVFSGTDDLMTELFVVVTADLMCIVFELGWFTGIVPLDGGQSLCRVDLERSSAHVEMVLLTTYGMMFPALAQSGD